MKINSIKISELPVIKSLRGFFTLGVGPDGKSYKVDLGLVQDATNAANDAADHPTYIGDDNYVYQWNSETRQYDKTGIYVKGETGGQGKQGIQGEQGVPGEPGPIGPQGPPGASASFNYTYIVDSDAALAAWITNAAGNDYTHVLIRRGTWSAPSVSDSVNNLTAAGTKTVVGESGSKLVFTGYDGMVYDTVPTTPDYYMFGVNVEVTSTAASDSTKAFLNCANLYHCTGVARGSKTSESLGVAFYGCKNLFNCNGNADAYDGWAYYECENLSDCYGEGFSNSSGGYSGVSFRNCKRLRSCIGVGKADGEADAQAFYQCEELYACGADYSFNEEYGSGLSFVGCRVMFGCYPLRTFTSSNQVYQGCYMNMSGTSNPVADTAVGGYNRITP